MKNIDYETYVSDPEIRRVIERAASRARNEAIYRFIVMSLAKPGGMLMKRGMQGLLLILILGNYRIYFCPPRWKSRTETDRSTPPRN